mmetsp:Transcript_39271/g.114723  ORF Transcript_39271/g.114723 Transcript_39271/m.114723 type:complete len:250 (-) Transcript_39271:318-1067(-)
MQARTAVRTHHTSHCARPRGECTRKRACDSTDSTLRANRRLSEFVTRGASRVPVTLSTYHANPRQSKMHTDVFATCVSPATVASAPVTAAHRECTGTVTPLTTPSCTGAAGDLCTTKGVEGVCEIATAPISRAACCKDSFLPGIGKPFVLRLCLSVCARRTLVEISLLSGRGSFCRSAIFSCASASQEPIIGSSSSRLMTPSPLTSHFPLTNDASSGHACASGESACSKPSSSPGSMDPEPSVSCRCNT